MLVSRWCYQSGPLKVIGQESLNAIGFKTRVNHSQKFQLANEWDHAHECGTSRTHVVLSMSIIKDVH